MRIALMIEVYFELFYKYVNL